MLGAIAEKFYHTNDVATNGEKQALSDELTAGDGHDAMPPATFSTISMACTVVDISD